MSTDPLVCAWWLGVLPLPPTETTGWLGWQMVDLPMVVCLPVLLLFSAFFSGSETALFGMTQTQRVAFRQTHPMAGRAVDALLDDQRMLLITVLLGNMTINVFYFVMSSVLMLRSTVGPVGQVVMAIVTLLAIVLLGEVCPKILASGVRLRFTTVTVPFLLAFHRAIGPLRIAIDRVIVAPLSRLTAPVSAPRELHDAELKTLVELSGRDGVLDAGEERMIREVLDMRHMRVQAVMTPRVRMVALPTTAGRDDVVQMTREHRLTKIPVYGEDIDDIVGVLHVKRFLLDETVSTITDGRVMTTPRFVPDLATLEQMLDHFQRWESASAIVVDEYGGTEGLVAIEDLVEEIVGDIVGPDEQAVAPPQLIGLGVWLVHGEYSVRAFAEAFRLPGDTARVSTVAGLVAEQLGRVPLVGDLVVVGPVTLEVQTVGARGVQTVTVTLTTELDS